MKKKCINILIIFLLIACEYKENKFVFPIITDSIPQTKSILNSINMIEGGYGIIGVSEAGLGFEIKNLDKKDDDYFDKVFMYQYAESEKEFGSSDEFIEIGSTKFKNIPPPPPTIFKREYTKVGNDNLKVLVDISQILNMPNYKNNLETNEKIKHGFNGVLKYSETIKQSYEKYYEPSKILKQAYPLIIINQTDSIIHIETKEGWLYMIQEALNENGKWKPIEYYDPFAFCGNSFWSKKLLPNHYVVSKIYKYDGAFKTKLRVKFTTNNKVYYSNEFEGRINYQQFELPRIISKKNTDKRNIFFFDN